VLELQATERTGEACCSLCIIIAMHPRDGEPESEGSHPGVALQPQHYAEQEPQTGAVAKTSEAFEPLVRLRPTV
jgi:hypothetical protein